MGPATRADELGFATARELADVMPDGIVVVGADGRIVFANGRLLELTGYAIADLVGEPVEILVPEPLRADHVGHREIFAQRPSVRPMGQRLQIACRRADGSTFDADLALSPFVGGGRQYTLAAVRDVTERKAAERAQHEVEERFRLLVESVESYAIFMLDPDGRVATWNVGAQRLKGYREEEILGQLSSVFYEVQDREDGKPQRLLDTAAAVGRVEDFGWRVRKDGSRFQATVTITAIRDEVGVLRGFAKVTRDVTEALRARDEVERVRLLEQREQLGRDLHDGIIQSIFAVGMILQSTSLRIEDAQTRQRIDQSVDELDHVIRDLRAFIFGLHHKTGTSEMLARELEGLAAEVRESAGLAVVMSVDEAALERIAHAAADVVLAVKEALSNVARHSGAQSCRVSVYVDGAVVVIEIDDDGRGFDPSAPRSGFGLTNMRSRAGAINGDYSLKTGPDGTTVRIRVPAS